MKIPLKKPDTTYFAKKNAKYAYDETKLFTYNSLVRSVPEYANIKWFSHTETGTKNM